MDRLKRKTFGKINLMLSITGVRDDGYHMLEMVMQTVSLYDIIEIRLRREKGIKLSCNLPFIPLDSRNIAVKAAESFASATGLEYGMDIDIVKAIPVGGGMGGGSSNAAGVLRMLNDMTGRPMSFDGLSELALPLGADVPFCLRRGTYLAEGIGERLTRLPDIPDCHIVICKPRVSVSTRNAYGIYDQYGHKEAFDCQAMVKALKKRDLNGVARAVGNSFEGPIAAAHPEISYIKNTMLEHGALTAAMTGSGSVVFGLFDSPVLAHRVKNMLRDMRYMAYYTRPVRAHG